jgi:LmbE family N-acetylglucosaminyl deacetylase
MAEESQRIVVAMAHPDGAEYSCAAAIAQWILEGHEIR